MNPKRIAVQTYARRLAKRNYKIASQAAEIQEKWRCALVRKARHTRFGRDHHFDAIRTYADFKARVPIRDYEALRPYISQILAGCPDVLWPGKPLYLSKTSGTTSGAKYIPISIESMPFHIRAAKHALLHYISGTQKTDFLAGKLIFLQGSPQLVKKSGIPTGRLSGIAAHHVPRYLQKNRLPSFQTNALADWETKLDAIVAETRHADMRLISGIPPWVQMYFEKLRAETGRPIGQIFPHFSLFVHGGVNYEPYRLKFEQLIGRSVDTLETYPASEGFIAYQDKRGEPGLLLIVDGGIFYEFVEAARFDGDSPPRRAIAEVELGKNYAVILNTNAGLWGYVLGDTVEFVSKHPHRVRVTGRLGQYTSAFGEHVIAAEVERSLAAAAARFGARVSAFTVAPQLSPTSGLPHHEWFVEFEREPDDLKAFSAEIDRRMQAQNAYYKDLIQGKMLRPLVLRRLQKNAFQRYMRSIGKLGGQNKVLHLADHREIADALEPFTLD